ncbi:MAG TPA: ECF-type sigma factor [Terracidiphilus sp.]|nr:ECF-type sigma factor [Terracidiphilus sp.]
MAVNLHEDPETHEVTLALQELRNQPDLLNERLFPLVYSAMKRIARRQMRGERQDVTLQPTALVNEVYIRLVRSKPDWQNRVHFLACASNAMRQILIEHARKRRALRRGGDAQRVVLDEVAEPDGMSVEYVLTLNAAMLRLQAIDPTKAKIIHLKFFGGLTMEDIAHVMKMGLTSTKEHYRLARAWLKRELSQ